MRCLGLFGGGADSWLAAAWLARRGVEVACVHFRTGFVKQARRRCVAELQRREPRELGFTLESVDVAEAYLREVVLEPRHGYGSAMNPCVDCRIFMLRRADELARERGIELLFTGEVVGQRAMDQSHAALRTIERAAGVDGRVLRPLSTALLPPTPAERAGRLVLGRRVRAHGRTRRVQLELARELGLDGLPTASGGCCLLADRGFARRLRDLLAHHERTAIGRRDLERLRRGRHFRLAWDTKVVLGRDEVESTWLREHAAGDWTCQAADGRGAFAVVEGDPPDARWPDVAAVVARYAGSRDGGTRMVELLARRAGDERRLRARAADRDRLRAWRI